MGVVVSLPNRASPGRAKTERVAFTKLRVEQLCERKPKAGTRYIFDKKEAGLCIRLTPANAQYVFYKWHNGAPERITIGKVGSITLPQARDIAAGYRGDLARGVDVFAAARAVRAAPRPATLADAYAAHIGRPDMRLSTRRDYESLWKVWIPARLKRRPLAEITSAELVTLHREIGDKHPRTANKILALLSPLFNHAGRRADNPSQGIERFREAPRQRVLTVDELRRLRSALESENEPWRSFFLLALLTGSRRGALQRAQWSAIDLDAAVWRIPAEWSKNRKVLTVALPTEAVAALRALHGTRGSSPWVFPSHSAAGHLTEPRKAWARVTKRAGIENAVPHDLRRTLGSAVAADGGGPAIIQSVLGHMSAASAKSYVHLTAEVGREAVEKAARRSSGAS